VASHPPTNQTFHRFVLLFALSIILPAPPSIELIEPPGANLLHKSAGRQRANTRAAPPIVAGAQQG
jgi:hypothetical protein